MTAEVRDEHRWLSKLVGEWTFEGPGPAEGQTFVGTEVVRPLGEIWVQCEGHGACGPEDGDSITMMTLGFDPARGRFQGTWIGSMMTHLWVYDGELDAASNTLTLESEGPNMSGEGMGKYRDVIQFLSDDHRTLTSHTQGEDGSWAPFMTMHYHRKK